MYIEKVSQQQENLQPQFSPKGESNKTHFKTDESEAAYQNLLNAFESLVAITDPIRFEVEFEKEQRRSGLRLTTFRRSYQAWLAQRERGGAA